MTTADLKQALNWYISGYDLQTIADHFKISKNQLKRFLNNQK